MEYFLLTIKNSAYVFSRKSKADKWWPSSVILEDPAEEMPMPTALYGFMETRDSVINLIANEDYNGARTLLGMVRAEYDGFADAEIIRLETFLSFMSDEADR